MLVTSIATNTSTPPYSIVDGLPPIPNAEHPSQKYQLPSLSLERYINELDIARARAYQLQIELDAAYAKLASSRDTINPFKSMLADMDITPLYGKNYGSGSVKVFPGQYEGAPAAAWGKSGVDRLNGPTRRPANDIAKKEKQLERIKQLIVDLERRVAVLMAERDRPALTPPPLRFELEGLEIVEEAPKVVPDTSGPVVIQPVEIPVAEDIPIDPVLLPDVVDEAADDSGVVISKPVVVSTSRQLQDVGKNPKELIEEIEAEKKASGKSFLEGKGGKRSFPGDGSEMIIGG